MINMKHYQKNEKENKKNISKDNFGIFLDRIDNMKVSKTISKKKEMKSETDSKHKKIVKFIVKYIVLIVVVLTIVLLIGGYHAFKNAEVYAAMNHMFSKALGADGSAGIQTTGIISSLIQGIIFGIWSIIAKIIISFILMPVCNIVDSLVQIVSYFVQGGLLRTFMDLIFISPESNPLRNVLIVVGSISLIVFVMGVITSVIKQFLSEEQNYKEIFGNAIKAGMNVFLFIVIVMFLYIFTSACAIYIINGAIVGNAVMDSPILNIIINGNPNQSIDVGGLRFSLILLNVCQTSGDTSALTAIRNNQVGVLGHYFYLDPTNGYKLDPTPLNDGDTFSNWFHSSAGYNELKSFDIAGPTSGSGPDGFLNGDELIGNGKALDYISGQRQEAQLELMTELGHSMNIPIFIISIVLSSIVFSIMTIQLFLRAFQITSLSLVAPYAAALTSYDGGEKFAAWKKSITDKFLQLFLFSILYAVYISLMLEYKVINDDFKNHFQATGSISSLIKSSISSIFSLVVIVGGAYAIIILPAEFAGIVGGISALVGTRMLNKTIGPGIGFVTGGASTMLQNSFSIMKGEISSGFSKNNKVHSMLGEPPLFRDENSSKNKTGDIRYSNEVGEKEKRNDSHSKRTSEPTFQEKENFGQSADIKKKNQQDNTEKYVTPKTKTKTKKE